MSSKNFKYPILVEHAAVPGTVYTECLILGGGVGEGILNEMELTETARPGAKNSLMKFRGKFQEAEAINANNRIYPYNVLTKSVKLLEEKIRNKRLTGELDHPDSSIVHLANASHMIENLWWDGNILMGEGRVLNTPSGQVLRALISDGVEIGMSSRGMGSGTVNEDNVLVIAENFKLVTFDAVADPSTFKAYQKQVIGSRKTENFDHTNEKVENSQLNKISSKALLACVQGLCLEHLKGKK